MLLISFIMLNYRLILTRSYGLVVMTEGSNPFSARSIRARTLFFYSDN